MIVFGYNHIQVGTSGYNGGYITLERTKGKLCGTWENDEGATITSDKNKKNSIETLSDSYTDLLYYLRPVRFKYNYGTSGRYHTGFIAQEVSSAIEKAGIDSQEFAGVVCFNRDTDEEEWGLRYSEFIALNTAAIQKLKSRVTELENIVAKLQEKEE